MKPHDINDKFLELSTILENFAEVDIKNLIACVHVLWLTGYEDQQKEALQQLARIASRASDKYQSKNIQKPTKAKDFDLSSWEPGPDDGIQ